MSKANTSIVNKLLETESPFTNSKIKLPNNINSAFLLNPSKNYPKLCPSTKIAVTSHRVPHVTIESVERKLRTIKELKAPGPDVTPNWLLKNFSYCLLAEVICYLINSSLEKQCLPTYHSHSKNQHIEEFRGKWQQNFLSSYLKENPKQYMEVYYRIFISALFGEIF